MLSKYGFLLRCILISLLVRYIKAERNHIEVYRIPNDFELHADGLMTTGVTLWAATNQLRMIFRDSRMVEIVLNELTQQYDVYINQRIAYSCHYVGVIEDGVLLNVIKEKNIIRIAPSPRSICNRQ